MKVSSLRNAENRAAYSNLEASQLDENEDIGDVLDPTLNSLPATFLMAA